jgi:ketosteroid isomerase-like protein
MSEENVELTRRRFEAMNRRDLEGLVALMDSEVVAVPRVVGVEGEAFHGHEGMRRWWEDVFAAFPDLEGEVIEIRAIEDVTLSCMRVRGHGQGSGAPIDDEIWIVSRFRDAKVVWWQTCGSERAALEAAGLSE